jgi:chromosome segregation ATPase
MSIDKRTIEVLRRKLFEKNCELESERKKYRASTVEIRNLEGDCSRWKGKMDYWISQTEQRKFDIKILQSDLAAANAEIEKLKESKPYLMGRGQQLFKENESLITDLAQTKSDIEHLERARSKYEQKLKVIIEEMATAHDFQVWVECMNESGEAGVYIEDGEVKTDNYNKD